MGNAGSQNEADDAVQQQIMMRLGDELASNPQQAEDVGQLLGMMMKLAQASADETVIHNENREIEIEGTTYELVQFVNRGGFGQVHKARVKNSGKIVAVKVLENVAEFTDELKNEIEFMRLTKHIPIQNHPIIDFYGSRVTKEHIYIAMELAACDLVTFWERRKSERNMAMIGNIIIAYVLRALAFLEQLHIVHGDIKPQNFVVVLTERAFVIKLIDFGTIEKMNTRLAQHTVDDTKGFTLFFVSPEFLRRNSRNEISRHLHKRSDAWAAGVMFYRLFCGRLPWRDQYEYENFCNSRYARDIVVPDVGGYKAIIELLLKKDPEQRSSAKATLMQMKAHPVFGKVLQTLQDDFGPVDDVCRMRVPPEVRQGLLKLGRAGHDASDSDASTFGTPDARRPCRYGSNCARYDPEHRKEFSHPNNPGKVPCRYGIDCRNNDPEHRKQFSHPNERSAGAGAIDRRRCFFGPACLRRDDQEHMKKYIHD